MASRLEEITESFLEDTSRCYSNYKCKYFPCHTSNSKRFNCIFCYCPMYYLPACLGKPSFIQSNGIPFKDCSACDVPHRPENYDRIIGYLIQMKRDWITDPSRQSDIRYRDFFQGVQDAVFINGREGTVIDCNEAALDLLGYTREEMEGIKNACFYACPDDKEKFQREIEENGFVKDYAMKLRRKDATVVLCLCTFNVWHAGDGSILGYQGIMRYVCDCECNDEVTPLIDKHNAERTLSLPLAVQAKSLDNEESDKGGIVPPSGRNIWHLRKKIALATGLVVSMAAAVAIHCLIFPC
ncbi:MAG: hypothetical protein C0402_12475 [Thermodesulfovibrio sp.]|nr:hypothetical protein [Thermodesulfovibrio sp.]